jgi:surfeit locus 1 family protein
MKPRLWPIVLWAGLGIAMLIVLGTWQLFRLAEKEAQLAEVAERTNAAPISLSEALARRDKGNDIEFDAVKVRGVFDHASERHKLASFEGSPGWQIITPFRSDEGIVALVDRGVVPAGLKDAAKRNESPALLELNAVVRAHGRERGFFDPDNDADGNLWYWWDVPAMLSSVAIAPDLRVAPFILQELPGSDPNRFPRAAGPEAELSNNHLQYAVTWFGLALTLLVIAGLFIRKQRKTTDA